MSKRQKRFQRFSFYLLLIFFWQTPALHLFFLDINQDNAIYAQTLTTPVIEEALVDSVLPTPLSLKQWQALQASASETLLTNPTTLTYLKNNFNIDGSYGELNSGAIVNDWETLAKRMGASGLALAGAYAVWRRRRLEYLEKLRSGDSAAIEGLFEESFGSNSPESELKPQTAGTQVSPSSFSHPPHNSETWQAWGKERGVPAAGATLAALYALWLKKKQATHANTAKVASGEWDSFFAQNFDENQFSHNYRDFYNRIFRATLEQEETDTSQVVAKFRQVNPSLLAPEKSENVKQYEALKSHYFMKSFMPFYQAVNEANALSKYDSKGRILAVSKGLEKVWEQYFYYQSVGNQQGSEIFRQKASDLLRFANWFANPQQKLELSQVRVQAETNFKNLKTQYTAYAEQKQAYDEADSLRTSQLNVLLTPLKQRTQTILNQTLKWWGQASQKVQDTAAWLHGLKRLSEESAVALAQKKAVQTQQLKTDFLQLIQRYSAEEINTLLAGKTLPQKIKNIPDIKTLKAKMVELKALKAEVTVWEKYKDKAFNAQGYLGSFRNGGYSKRVYNEHLQRWENRRIDYRFVDDRKVRADFEAYYDGQIYTIQQAIIQAEADTFRQQIETLSGVSWLSEIESFDGETTAETLFPPVVKTETHLALAAQVAKLSAEKETAYNALKNQEQQSLQFLQNLRTSQQYVWWLNRTHQYNSRGKQDQYYALIDDWTRNTQKSYAQRRKELDTQYESLSTQETQLKVLEEQHQQAVKTQQAAQIAHKDLQQQVPIYNRLKTFIQTLQRFPQDRFSLDVIEQFQALRQWQEEWQAVEHQLYFGSLDSVQRLNQQAQLETLKTQINTVQEKLVDYENYFRKTETEKETSVDTTKLEQALLQHKIDSHPVTQFLRQQAESKAFYQQYGESKDTALPRYRAEVENLLNQATKENGGVLPPDNEVISHYYKGLNYVWIHNLKKDLALLRAGKIPDKNWSDWTRYGGQTPYYYRPRQIPVTHDANLDQLHYQYLYRLPLYGEKDLVTQQYKQALQESQTQVRQQRASQWETQFGQSLTDSFTPEQIAEYQSLLTTQKEQTEIQITLQTAESLVSQVKSQEIITRNQTLYEDIPDSRNQAIQTLKKSEVATLSVNTANPEANPIPPHILEPLWQAYRRYNQSYELNLFKTESKRLIAQAEANYKRSLTADAGLPSPPAQTKTVRDYLEDPSAFNKAIDQQIAEINAGIPLLKTKFAGQNYLKTALKQADEKIKALERYRQSGPQEVTQYQQALAQWEQNHKEALAQIDSGVKQKFAAYPTYLEVFWTNSARIVAQKTAEKEAEKIIDTREAVEKVVSSPGNFSSEDEALKTELAKFLANRQQEQTSVETNPSFKLTNQAALSQSKIYKTYESEFLRSQGLTSSVRNNVAIQVLHPDIRKDTIDFINALEDRLSLKFTITNGYRSHEEQDILYAQGRDNDNPIITNAKGGESYHNYGLAFDIVEIKNRQVNYTLDWEKISVIAKEYGFEWGGDWESFPDKPHFQKSFGLDINDLKNRTENEESIDGYVNLNSNEELNIQDFEIQQNIIENIKAGRDPYAVEVAGVGFTVGVLVAQKMAMYGEDNPNWLAKALIKYGKLNQSIIKGDLNASDFPIPVLIELLEINNELKNNLESHKIWMQSIESDFGKVLYNLSNFITTASEKINYTEGNLVEATITAPASLPYSDASALARAVYDLKDTVGPYKRVTGDALLEYGIQESDLIDVESGLQAALYTSEDYTVLSFAGTDPSSLVDIKTNFTQSLGLKTPQYDKAINLRIKLELLDLKNFAIVGQSLGGGLAAAAAAGTEIDSKIFNAAGVHPNTISSYSKDFDNISHFYTRGEILNVLQTLTPLRDVSSGNTVFIGDHLNYLHYLNSNKFKVINAVTQLHSVY